MSTRAFFTTGVSGTEQTPAARAFVRNECSWNIIPFRRDLQTSAQATVLSMESAASGVVSDYFADLLIPVDGAPDPVHPATTSATMMDQVIRHGIGFQGLLMSNDVPMKSLTGSLGGRTCARFTAGTPLRSNDNAQLDALIANTASA